MWVPRVITFIGTESGIEVTWGNRELLNGY